MLSRPARLSIEWRTNRCGERHRHNYSALHPRSLFIAILSSPSQSVGTTPLANCEHFCTVHSSRTNLPSPSSCEGPHQTAYSQPSLRHSCPLQNGLDLLNHSQEPPTAHEPNRTRDQERPCRHKRQVGDVQELVGEPGQVEVRSPAAGRHTQRSQCSVPAQSKQDELTY